MMSRSANAPAKLFCLARASARMRNCSARRSTMVYSVSDGFEIALYLEGKYHVVVPLEKLPIQLVPRLSLISNELTSSSVNETLLEVELGASVRIKSCPWGVLVPGTTGFNC